MTVCDGTQHDADRCRRRRVERGDGVGRDPCDQGLTRVGGEPFCEHGSRQPTDDGESGERPLVLRDEGHRAKRRLHHRIDVLDHRSHELLVAITILAQANGSLCNRAMQGRHIPVVQRMGEWDGRLHPIDV